MPNPRVAMKISEQALDMISEITGASSDVLGDDTYVLFEIVSIEPLEFNAKFMNEERIFAEVKQDSDVHILTM